MTQLFLTQACDHCDYGPNKESLFKGYVVCSQDNTFPSEEYVFRSLMDAERWKTVTAAAKENSDIFEVYSLNSYRWHLSQGTVRDIVLADRMYTIHADHKYPAGAFQAFFYKKRPK